MLQVFERLGLKSSGHKQQVIDDSITLDFDTRQKARIKGTTDKGLAIAIFVERGHPLKIGDLLKSECGQFIEVLGSPESVTTAVATDWLTFSKVCYHLGNRHTRLQVGELWLRFQPDHVLAELVLRFGLTLNHQPEIFEPESGAYGAGHSHGHHHGHFHEHAHE
ncbi:urease accessory protein UreE [Thalassomonas actiniarum]|uniref:Urease accessory protein UreE n=1 Tax=Thalassomonas actiniarum TaxID=485447 RepID=A0AAE9YPH8_9GAMM|nr:urease accessory protein UreE [Thalassomonas actiniarum]WDD98840.1 urease accessory protein UreE [Thalassomonas actiniarum]